MEKFAFINGAISANAYSIQTKEVEEKKNNTLYACKRQQKSLSQSHTHAHTSYRSRNFRNSNAVNFTVTKT